MSAIDKWRKEVSAHTLKCGYDACEEAVEVGKLIIGYKCGKHSDK